MKFDFIIILQCLFVIIYITRIILVNKFIINEIKYDNDLDRKRIIFFIYSIPINDHYKKSVISVIKTANLFSKLIVLVIVLNFISIFLENLIRDMG